MNTVLEVTEDSGEAATKGMFLTFLIGEETYGIEIENVMEIIGLQPITAMLEMPDYIRGIINLRGSIILAMDARLRFKMQEKDYSDRTCIIVMNLGGILIGLIVDCVSDVLTIPSEDIAEKPEISAGGSRGYVKSIGKKGSRIILLIDCQKLLNEEEFKTVTTQL